MCALGMAIIVGTSTPILGKLFRSSPSGVPLEFYNRWTLPLTAGMVFFMGLGQLFWWNKMSAKRVNEVLLKPLVASIFSTALVLGLSPFTQTWILDQAPSAVANQMESASVFASMFSGTNYVAVLMALFVVFFGFFALYGNIAALWKVGRGNFQLAGGAISHIGIALMILGIIASSGFNNPIDGKFNRVGAKDDGRSNFTLELGETRRVEGFTMTYKGKSFTPEGYSAFDLDVTDDRGRSYSLTPVVYKSTTDQWIQHPDIKTYMEKDLYIAVAPSAMFDTEETAVENDAPTEIRLTQGSSIQLENGSYSLEFEKFDMEIDLASIPMDDRVNPNDVEIAVASVLNVTQISTGEVRTLKPIYLVMKDRSQQFIQNRIADWQASFTFAGLDISSGEIRLLVDGMSVPKDDWIVVQAYKKPFINLLWLGMFIMLGGFGLSLYRRTKEWHLSLYRKGSEV